MKINPEFIPRQVDNEYLLIPVGSVSNQMNGLITLNEMGAFIIEHIRSGMTDEEIIIAILDEFDSDKETVEKDYYDFIEKMKQKKVIL